MSTRKFNLLLAALLIWGSNVFATNYYASPSGTGAGTSYSTPCSLSTALSKIASGDSLFLLDGQYNLSSKMSISKSGTAAKRTFIGAYHDEKPIFDFRSLAHGQNGVTLGGTYIHLKGITIRYAGYKGLINSGSFNLMEMLDVYGNCDSGIQQKGGNNNTILNCDSHDNFDYETGSISDCDFGGNADGFADKQYTNSPGNTYIGCRSWNNSDDGWDFYQRVGGTTIIRNCVCYNNGPKYYDLSNYPRLTTDASWFKDFKKDTTVIADGTKYTCSISHYYNHGNGNGFKLGGGSTLHDVTLYNCLSVANRVKGFDQNSDAGAIQIYNGTSYLNGSNYGFYNNNGYSLVIKNCISLDSKGSNQFTGSKITSTNNTWLSGYSCSDADFVSLDTAMVRVERNADGSLPITTLLRLKKGSFLIDKGVVIAGEKYNGAAPDLGCFETDYTNGISSSTVQKLDPSRAINIYSMSGILVSESTVDSFNATTLPHGIYIVCTADTCQLISKVIR